MQRSASQPRRTAEPQNVHLLLTAATEVDSSASGPRLSVPRCEQTLLQSPDSACSLCAHAARS
jgi:hypothetical protein